MFDAYKDFWKRYVDFSGVSTASEYWFVVLSHILLFLLFILFTMLIGGVAVLLHDTGSFLSIGLSAILMGIQVIYLFAIMLPMISLSVRRLRDGGFPWGLIFLRLIPFVGWIALIVLHSMPTKKEENFYTTE